jgi:hypothetical protein
MKEANDLGKKQVLEDRRRCRIAHIRIANEHWYGSSSTHGGTLCHGFKQSGGMVDAA